MINCRFYFSNLIHPQIRLVITLALWRNHIPTFWILGRASKSYWLIIWWFLERVLHLIVSYKTASKMLLQRSIILLVSWEKQTRNLTTNSQGIWQSQPQEQWNSIFTPSNHLYRLEVEVPFFIDRSHVGSIKKFTKAKHSGDAHWIHPNNSFLTDS